jgi:hypothetical protein
MYKKISLEVYSHGVFFFCDAKRLMHVKYYGSSEIHKNNKKVFSKYCNQLKCIFKSCVWCIFIDSGERKFNAYKHRNVDLNTVSLKASDCTTCKVH